MFDDLPFTLHDYQIDAVTFARAKLLAREQRMIVSPTGSGKSYMQAATLLALREDGLVQTTPNIEISLSIFRKMVGSDQVLSWSEAQQQRACEENGIWTIKRLHNELMAGTISLPRMLSFDEAQHTVDNTHDTVWALCGNCPSVGWTATAFRGTPEETKKLIDRWGKPFIALSLKDAIKRGVVAMPDFQVWPLLDDESIAVTNGEFVTSAVDSALTDKLIDIVDRIGSLYDRGAERWQRPTMVCVSSVASADLLTLALNQAGLPALSVTGDTNRREREAIFQATAYDRTHILVQVKVVGEGVDLPFRVQIDLAPTMSPMWFMQRVGRATRPTGPGEAPPVIIVCNHNFTRHAYLWAGLVPSSQVKAAQQAWGPEWKPTRKSLARALGLEGFGKFVVASVPTIDGTLVSLYALQTKDGTHQYVVLLHPCREEPWFFERSNVKTGKKRQFEKPDGSIVEYDEKVYGKWKRIEGIPDATGYASVKPQAITDKMLGWWTQEKGGAKSVGLDPEYIPNAREFMTLPVLSNARMRFKQE